MKRFLPLLFIFRNSPILFGIRSKRAGISIYNRREYRICALQKHPTPQDFTRLGSLRKPRFALLWIQRIIFRQYWALAEP